MDLHNPRSGLLGGGGELDLPVQPAGAEEGGIQDVDPVRRRDHFDVVLWEKLKFYLNLWRTTRAQYPGTTSGILKYRIRILKYGLHSIYKKKLRTN